MKTSPAGLKFIIDNEGRVLHAYQDGVGVWTIGTGHTAGVTEGMTITEEQNDAFLASDVESVENALNKLIPSTCTQNQFDAVIDFGFNLGIGSMKQLIGHGWENIPYQLYHEDEDGTQHGWIYAGGKIVQGLVERRKREIALFNS